MNLHRTVIKLHVHEWARKHERNDSTRWSLTLRYRVLGACNRPCRKHRQQRNSTRLDIGSISELMDYNLLLTRYIVRLLNLDTVKAKMVALKNPQQVFPKLITFLVWLSWIPTLSRIRAKKYLIWVITSTSMEGAQKLKAHDVRPLPLHWVARPMKAPIMIRFLIPEVAISCFQPTLELSLSNSKVFSISTYSALTNSDVSSPSAWYFTKMAMASSPRPLEINHRGDSGMNKMNMTWRELGMICRRDGILQPQLDASLNVPRVVPAAAMEPARTSSRK